MLDSIECTNDDIRGTKFRVPLIRGHHVELIDLSSKKHHCPEMSNGALLVCDKTALLAATASGQADKGKQAQRSQELKGRKKVYIIPKLEHKHTDFAPIFRWHAGVTNSGILHIRSNSHS